MTPVALKELLAGIAAAPIAADATLSGIAQDSRAVQAGDLFIALATDARVHAHIAQACAQGAAAVVYDAAAPEPTVPVPAIAIPALVAKTGVLAARFFGDPSRALTVIGVTGTNGKTTCTQILAQVMDRPDARCAVIGTVGSGFPGALVPSSHTTPDAVTVQRLLAEFRAAGARYVCMEVSSHALVQGRVDAVRFAFAVFTNLTRDHLDYHGDMVAYAAAKARLFDFPHLQAAIVNADDAYGRTLAARVQPRAPVTTFGLAAGDVHARAIELTPTGVRFAVQTPHAQAQIEARLLGEFNVANLLAVIATALAAGMALPAIAQALAGVKAPPGRMECFGGAAAPLAVIDYAHTPDALEKALQATRAHTHGTLWCVFGCGGDRDRGKRPLMGAVAERLADRVVVTDDNPRHEESAAIIADIIAGMQKQPTVIPDRAQAIRSTLTRARRGDAVLIAGKGHEDYQQIGAQKFPFSDRSVVQEILGAAA